MNIDNGKVWLNEESKEPVKSFLIEYESVLIIVNKSKKRDVLGLLVLVQYRGLLTSSKLQ